MVLTFTLSILKLLVKTGYWFRLLPVVWDESSSSFMVIHNISYIQQWRVVTCFLSFIYLSSSIWFLSVILNGKESLSFLFLNTICIAQHFAGVLMVLASSEMYAVICRVYSLIEEYERSTSKSGNNKTVNN